MTETDLAAIAAPEPPKDPSFWLWSDRLDILAPALEKITKKCAKLGFPAPEIKVLETKFFPEKLRHPEAHGGKTERLREASRVLVTGEPPRVAGWTFVATLQHLEGEVIVRTVPGCEVPASYRKADPRHCDHCNTERRRLDTFVLRGDDGGFKQVGRNCLADFLNTTSPNDVAQLAAALADLARLCGEAGDEFEGMGGGGGGGNWSPSIGEFLTVAARMIREFGFRGSKSESKTTQSWVWSVLFPPSGMHPEDIKFREELREYERTINDDDREHALAALEWVLALPESESDSDYIHNLRVAANQNVVRERTGGLLASLIAAYDRANPTGITPDAITVERKPSEYVGTLKKREVFELTLIDFRSFEREAYGWSGRNGYTEVTFIYNFADDAGNLLTWFASSNQHLEKGDRVRVKATVKKHEEFRGAKVTYLTRCVIEARLNEKENA
jgi:hypothetical protein